MDFIESAGIIVPALSGLAVTVWEQGAGDALAGFEGRFCFMPGLQPLFTQEGALRFFSKKDAEKIYYATDELGIHAVFVMVGSRWIIIGPFVTSAWKEDEARKVLAKARTKGDSLLLFKNYYCALPIVSAEYAVRTAALLLVNTVGNPPREVEYVDLGVEDIGDIPPRIAESYEEISVVQYRYQLEDQLVQAVRQGHTAEALRTISELSSSAKGLRFMSDSIRDQIAGAAVMRTLVRHAALKAGLMPVLVDALSQEYAQKMHAVSDTESLAELSKQYIAAFCAAVRAYNDKGDSPQVKKAIQYIQVHLSDTITVDELSGAVGMSRQHFIRLFKAETGYTVKQYIAKARCECAVQLLENSQLRIQDIAYYVGYEDANYFTRIFKTTTGFSPQEYRDRKLFL